MVNFIHTNVICFYFCTHEAIQIGTGNCKIKNCDFQVTDSYNIVLTQDVVTDAFHPDLMVTHIRRLVRERDEYLQVGFYSYFF
jgi:hypothetical protein